MAIIRKLPKEVVEKIAAGEVVERPASIVKELVENSIDAGATSITVDIKDGGKERIAVIDDGCGMDADDLSICILRHATSKIKDESDLWKINTMGFRGEALYAVGAVSKLLIETKINRNEIVEGSRLKVDGGVVCSTEFAGCPGGTKVIVSDLFFNVPARQKFLRSAAVEGGHVVDVITNLALAFPDIRFELTSDGRRRFASSISNLKERVISVLGEHLRDELIPVEEEGVGLEINGWVALGGRSAGKDVYVFLNRRPVRDRLLMHAVTKSFGERLAFKEYPVSVLWIDIDPSLVDVNVHPTKREVRFSNGGGVHDFVLAAVRKSLNSVQTATPLVYRKAGAVADAGLSSPHGVSGDPVHIKTDWIPASAGMTNTFVPNFELQQQSQNTRDDLRVLGQLGETYVVCEDDDSTLVLIDQHAAHERLGFDALLRHYANGVVPAQKLLVPESIELGEKELAYVMEHADALAKSGFEIEPFGGGTILVKAVPEILGSVNLRPVFEQLASELEELGSTHSIEDAIKQIFSVVACHKQVRGGDKLSNDELTALIRAIERENITHCPHGRPAIVRIEKNEIEKWFKRS